MAGQRPYYEDERVVIYCGDCRVIVPSLGLADVVITDPPYDERTHTGARTSGLEERQAATTDGSPLAKAGIIAFGFDKLASVNWTSRLRYCAHRWCLIFCSLEQLGAYQEIAGDDYIRGGIWQRYGAPQFSGDRPAQGAEGIAILHRAGEKRWNGGGSFAFWTSSRIGDPDRVHPTQKPEDLILQLVQLFSEPGEIILDPFMGSGTTLVAATRLGRKAIGIEQNEQYCAIAVDRLSQRALPLDFGV